MSVTINDTSTTRMLRRQMEVLGAKGESLSDSLSTGDKVVGAAEDTITKRLTIQLGDTLQAIEGLTHGKSVLTTISGALDHSFDTLKRMRNLMAQATNGAFTDEVRAQIDVEFQGLKHALDQTAKNVDFNRLKLLDGSISGNEAVVTVAAEAAFTGTTVGGIDFVGAKAAVNSATGTAEESVANNKITITLTPATGKTSAADMAALFADVVSGKIVPTVKTQTPPIVVTSPAILKSFKADYTPGTDKVKILDSKKGMNFFSSPDLKAKETIFAPDLTLTALEKEAAAETKLTPADVQNMNVASIASLDNAKNILEVFINRILNTRTKISASSSMFENNIQSLTINATNTEKSKETIGGTDIAATVQDLTQVKVKKAAAMEVFKQNLQEFQNSTVGLIRTMNA